MAANPVLVPCPADVWTKVATSVLTGVIHKVSYLPVVYVQNLRLTGAAAPANDTEAVAIFDGAESAIISSDAAIDVYVKPRRYAGEVRVDL